MNPSLDLHGDAGHEVRVMVEVLVRRHDSVERIVRVIFGNLGIVLTIYLPGFGNHLEAVKRLLGL